MEQRKIAKIGEKILHRSDAIKIVLRILFAGNYATNLNFFPEKKLYGTISKPSVALVVQRGRSASLSHFHFAHEYLSIAKCQKSVVSTD